MAPAFLINRVAGAIVYKDYSLVVINDVLSGGVVYPPPPPGTGATALTVK